MQLDCSGINGWIKCVSKYIYTVFRVAFETAGYFRSFLCGVISYYSWAPTSMCLFFIPPLAHRPSHLLISPFLFSSHFFESTSLSILICVASFTWQPTQLNAIVPSQKGHQRPINTQAEGTCWITVMKNFPSQQKEVEGLWFDISWWMHWL